METVCKAEWNEAGPLRGNSEEKNPVVLFQFVKLSSAVKISLIITMNDVTLSPLKKH
jgi:hypothetical protein